MKSQCIIIISCVICLLYFSHTVNCFNRTLQPKLQLAPLSPLNGTALIWYNPNSRESIQNWTNAINKFLEPYNNPYEDNGQNCNGRRPDKNHFCLFGVDQLSHPCTQELDYGFAYGRPCLFLTLSKIPGWIPEYYNSTTAPLHIPTELKSYINVTEEQRKYRAVWVHCSGENAADIELLGPIIYYPQRGFGEEYFPLTNAESHLSPLVAVYLAQPMRGVAINVICRAWAHNIHHDLEKKMGSLRFVLMVDF